MTRCQANGHLLLCYCFHLFELLAGKMNFCSIGEFQVILQQYKFRSHKILCTIKILPDVVKLYKNKEPENDYNWMTAARWSRLESCLQRTLADIDNWKREACKLKVNMQVDNFKVSIKATQQYLPASEKLLNDDELSKVNLGLEIVLQYMSHEDIIIQSNERVPFKRTQLDAEGRNNSTSRSSKTKESELQSSQKASSSSKIPPSSLSSRDRRSMSLDSKQQKISESITQSEHMPRKTRSKRLKSPRSRSNSREAKQERRSPRSPIKTDRYREYVISKEKSRKHKIKDSVQKDDSSSKKMQISAIKPSPIVQLNGEALRKINEMLDVPKPRKVDILLLEDMDEATVLNTFEKYRVNFDQVFEERQHKFQTTNYLSIDHCHIMHILNETIRSNMIKKLGEVYCKSGPHGTLIINALLPLWIIRLFMDKYQFTEDEAVRQIADQLKYSTYQNALKNEPLCLH
ncbi:uncharacterized protein CG4951 [Drosophila albomicans]|uniref:Uncharacterized protein CG4951 n=1 Tax=Drosophila albomicans TaxID=7291 RepID=A0A6P8XJ49_DROAB|nr:uncharacterized protein CG4951 [Drosophila albomicans]